LESSAPLALHITAITDGSIREWDASIDQLLRTGELRAGLVARDTLVADRTHERLTQFYHGIPIFGADITRQLSRGVTVSIFGTLYTNVNVDTSPTLLPEDARAVVERLTGVEPGPRDRLALTILPTRDGRYALTYQVRVIALPDAIVYFVDAHSAQVLFQYSDLKTQAVVGTATGVLGDTKKISTERRGIEFRAVDRLRPPMLEQVGYGGTTTFDMKGDTDRIGAIVRGQVPGDANIATDADNDWTERAVGDAHVYAGWVTDYFFKRFNRRGLDDRFIELWNFVNPVRLEDFSRQRPEIQGAYYCNAAYIGFGNMVYGVGLPQGVRQGGRDCLPLSGALDAVAHELTHGLTDFGSNLIYLNESGALNEAFSDMLATSVEFFFQPPGSGPLRADYLLAEDVVTPGGFRSMQAPRGYGHPDHRRLRCCVGTSFDNGGVHINSGIPNHAFFLAIEGGQNATSGLSVAGVGPANREQIERIFYRAFVFLLPSNANFLTARSATIQAARDLYGAGSPAEHAVTQAWDAVGLSPRANVEVAFWPNPVRATGECTSVPSPCWDFVGSILTPPAAYTVNAFDLNFFDAAGSAIGTSKFDGAGFVGLFDSCGPASTRVGPNAEACLWVRVSLGGRPAGAIQFVFRGILEDGRSMEVASERLPLLALAGVAREGTGVVGRPSMTRLP
jgi:Zn-dependent metalloprotease